MRFEEAWGYHDEALAYLQRMRLRAGDAALESTERREDPEDVRIAVAVEGNSNDRQVSLRIRTWDEATERAVQAMWDLGAIPADCRIDEVGRLVGFGPGDLVQPLRAGISCAHELGSRGTLGAILRRGSDLVLLSANHVLTRENLAVEGDEILQPIFGDPLARVVGELLDYEKLTLVGNRMDAAVARITVSDVDDIQFNGKRIREVRTSALVTGEPLFKFGQSTFEKSGSFLSIVSNVELEMERNIYAFDHHIEVEAIGDLFSFGGDSGALVYDAEDRAVGIVIGGSFEEINGSFRTYISPIGPILHRYQASFL